VGVVGGASLGEVETLGVRMGEALLAGSEADGRDAADTAAVATVRRKGPRPDTGPASARPGDDIRSRRHDRMPAVEQEPGREEAPVLLHAGPRVLALDGEVHVEREAV